MWTRGKDSANPDKFEYSLYTDTGILVERIGGFATHTEAERAAQVAQRGLTNADQIRLQSSRDYMDAIETEMTDDELLAALGV